MPQRFRSIAVAALLLLTPAALFAQDWDRWERRDRSRDDAHIRIAGDYTLNQGSTLRGPLVVIGGTATLHGTVQDDVTVVGGRIIVGPTAIVDGDLHSVGGTVDIDPAARISGRVEEVTASWGDIPWRIENVGSRFWSWISAWLSILRLSLVFVAGILVTLLVPGWMRSVGHQATDGAGWSAATGFAAEVLVTPAIVALCVALVITIIGIPLLAAVPILIGLLVLLWIGGFTAVAVRLGEWVSPNAGPVLGFVIGFLVLTGVSIVAQIVSLLPAPMSWISIPLGGLGLFVEYVAWTVGLGAALLVLFNGRGTVMPPPLPPRSDAPVSAPA